MDAASALALQGIDISALDETTRQAVLQQFELRQIVEQREMQLRAIMQA